MLSWMLLASLAEAKKAPKAPPAPPVGWYQEAGWKGSCYYPPAWDKMLESDRRNARQQALEGMKSQWSGEKEDGVQFDSNVIEDVEVTLLGRPVLIEAVSQQNLDQCKAVMGGGSVDAWSGWFSGLRSKLNAGECMQPLTYTLFDYLDIGRSWQRPVTLCKGDRAHIFATVADKYRITDNGEWITVVGTTEKATGADWPCNVEGCTMGMLVGKFTTDAGVEAVFPIGADTVYVAPENGTLTWSINDTTWYDNKWFKSATIEDHAAVTVEPAR